VGNRCRSIYATGSDQTAQVEFTPGTTPMFTINADGSVNAPSFGFGTHNLTGLAQLLHTFDFINRKNTSDTYTGSVLQVSDLSSQGNGWAVKTKVSTTIDGNHSLAATKLTLSSADGLTVADGTNTPDGNNIPALSNDLELDSDADFSTLITADKDSGMGIFNLDLANSTLQVPNAQYAGNYVSDLTYSIEATPAI
jgi:hypothetical protein